MRRSSVEERDSKNSRWESTVPPRTMMFFSGRRFPLATESSMELQRSFLASPFLVSEPPDAAVYVEKRFELFVAMAAPEGVV